MIGEQKRVALYLRISTDEVNQPYSLEAQDVRLRDFVRSQPDQQIVATFTDHASGAKYEREHLQRALAAAERGEFDTLLVYRTDRLARSLMDLLKIVERLNAAGATLRSATEPVDSDGPMGTMMLQQLGVWAQFERAMIIDRIQQGLERKAHRGLFLGGTPPLGYRIDPATKVLLQVEDEAALVRLMFSKYVNDRLGTPELAKWLNATGRTTRKGKSWSAQTVLKVLENQTYLGLIKFNDEVLPGVHEAIIDETTFDAARELRQIRSESCASRASNDSDFLLGGVVRCGGCDGAYVGTSAYGRSRRYRYYECSTRRRYGLGRCDASRVDADAVETGLATTLIDALSDLGVLEQAIERALERTPSEHEELRLQQDAVASEIKQIRSRIDRYLLAFEDGAMTPEICGDRVRALQVQEEALEQEQLRLAEQLPPTHATIPSAGQLEHVREEIAKTLPAADPKQLKRLYQAILHAVVVHANGEIEPRLRTPYRADALSTPVRPPTTQVEVAVCSCRTSRTGVAGHSGRSRTLGGCRKRVWSSPRLCSRGGVCRRSSRPTACRVRGCTNWSLVTVPRAGRRSSRARGDRNGHRRQPRPRLSR